jgi:formiminotetrahydrofolate cyclodeaminase
VDEFLAAVAAREPVPGGGAVAAITVAAAAGLVAMAARFSESSPDAAAVAAEADDLRAAAVHLADSDADAYGAVLGALRSPRDAGREERRRAALQRAADVPERIAAAGAAVTRLGADLARRGNQRVLGDVQTGVLLAEAAVRAAENLVQINTDTGGLDPWTAARARSHARAAATALDVVRIAASAPARPV